jgi:hypothetical protein
MFDLERAIKGEAICMRNGMEIIELAYLPSARSAHKLYGVSVGTGLVLTWTESGIYGMGPEQQESMSGMDLIMRCDFVEPDPS